MNHEPKENKKQLKIIKMPPSINSSSSLNLSKRFVVTKINGEKIDLIGYEASNAKVELKKSQKKSILQRILKILKVKSN